MTGDQYNQQMNARPGQQAIYTSNGEECLAENTIKQGIDIEKHYTINKVTGFDEENRETFIRELNDDGLLIDINKETTDTIDVFLQFKEVGKDMDFNADCFEILDPKK